MQHLIINGEHYVVAYEGGLGACRCGVVTSDGLIDAHVREANGA